MDVLGGQNHVKLAVLLDDVALANRTGDDSQSGLSWRFWPGTEQDTGVLKASEAVSGRNILILPIYASLLRRSRATENRRRDGLAGG